MILREKDKLALLDILSSLGYPIEVWAYGSRVNGSAHTGSDLDLAVRGQNGESLPFAVYSKLLEKIQDSNIPILVDIRDFYALPQAFRKNIENEYEVLYRQ